LSESFRATVRFAAEAAVPFPNASTGHLRAPRTGFVGRNQKISDFLKCPA
jgi:hypothetical protein